MFLTPDELQRLTGRVRYTAQRRVLDERRIRYVTAASGEPLVRPEWLDAAGKPAKSPHRWDRIGGAGAQVSPIARARR